MFLLSLSPVFRACSYFHLLYLPRVSIALVGKYTGMSDAYLSVLKALKHAATHAKRDLDLVWIESSDLEDVKDAQVETDAATATAAAAGSAPGATTEANTSAAAAASSSYSSSSSTTVDPAAAAAAAANEPSTSASPHEKHEAAWAKLKGADGIIVPGGFGDRGVEGKVLTAQYAREHHVPYLGVCLGMQMLVVEYARHVLGCAGANSTEFDNDTKHPTVSTSCVTCYNMCNRTACHPVDSFLTRAYL